jgi:hypothetical protein
LINLVTALLSQNHNGSYSLDAFDWRRPFDAKVFVSYESTDFEAFQTNPKFTAMNEWMEIHDDDCPSEGWHKTELAAGRERSCFTNERVIGAKTLCDKTNGNPRKIAKYLTCTIQKLW